MKSSNIPVIDAFYMTKFQIKLEEIPMRYWFSVYWHYLKAIIRNKKDDL